MTAVDVSARALEAASAVLAPQAERTRLLQADLLDLPRDVREFDLVLEHTCFCAIDPVHRDGYVDATADALRPAGRLLGLFFMIEPEEGPPFGATEEEIRHRFGKRFDVDLVEVPEEPHRCPHGREWLFLMTRRA